MYWVSTGSTVLQLWNCWFTFLPFSVSFNIHFWNLKYDSLNIYILRMNDTRLLYPITCIGMQNILEHICNPIEYNSDWGIVLSMSTFKTSWPIFLSIENLFTSALGKKLCIIFLEYYGCFEIIEIQKEVKDALNIDTLNHLINSQIIW